MAALGVVGVIVKIVVLFLAFIAILGMFGKLSLLGIGKRRRVCRDCGGHVIGKSCPCGKSQ
ncbi:hypothetical protein SAMN06273572_101559 [Monaibacterium marinum]|uniref:Uncharacterized protein n=1 Tax=Pontivivens marinum TaxID=1690039 RepID=A0A2C9CMG3_9RHOB|nr:hypothetical protein SAMN06273572_101559 [Monaibacterium marinum]